MQKFLSIIMCLFALPLVIGGGYLLYLGGSPYYVVAGVLMLTSAWLLLKRQWLAYALYSIFIVGSVIWAVWESGFYWWALATRLGFPLIFGLLMLLPWVARKMGTQKIKVLTGPSNNTLHNASGITSNTPLNTSSPQATADLSSANEGEHNEGSKKSAYYWALLASVVAGAAVSFGSMANNATDKLGALDLKGDSATPANMGDPLSNGQQTPEGEWSAYGRTDYGQRYSPLTQINTDNVKNLEVAWQIQTGDVKGPNDVGETTYQATPLKLGNALYMCTPHNWALALDADTGEALWKFDPKVGENLQRQHQTCRGVSFYAGTNPQTSITTDIKAQKVEGNTFTKATTQCDAKIFIPTSDAKLYALNPETGQRCQDFGNEGAIDLMHNMPFKQAGYYYSTSPPIVAGDVIIVAGAVNDNYDINSPSGVIRAYDVNTGQLMWNWDAGNPEDTKPLDINDPNQTYKTSSPNSWAIASADEKLGLAYFPMGNRTPDQLGVYRSPAEEKYATSVVALDLKTGQARWVQQFVHHDLWDMDTPAQPSLSLIHI